jgi:hypothetical protein
VIWNVDDDGTVKVVLDTTRGALPGKPSDLIHNYLQSVTEDLANNDIELIRDEYRLRFHKGIDRVQIIWKAVVAEADVPATRRYLETLARSIAGE